jgi:tRNA A-37 threonylcarbamoyl transferase component Bud32
VDQRYLTFCGTDSLFYDTPRSGQSSRSDFVAAMPESGDWVERDAAPWHRVAPAEASLPPQGWKIHVSVTMDNADRVLAAVRRYCTRNRIAFKHLLSRQFLLQANAKYAARGSSGKFITIYPDDEESLRTTLADLSAELDGEDGPYVLSDLRYGDGPLYVRYGGFVPRWLDNGDTRVLAIVAPDGTLVPDRREPRFSIPEWVTLPSFLNPHLRARRADAPEGFPYTLVEALHFSNGGGVYRATRTADGHRVVLKEARPHAGLDHDGSDAVTRLRREHDVLLRLRGIPGIAEVYEHRTLWEHHFLAMEDLPGTPLSQWMARNYPLAGNATSEKDIAEYAVRTLALVERITRLVTEVHQRGVVIGDLHPGNILIDESGEVHLIDFEMGFDAAAPRVGTLAAPGFRAPPDRCGIAVDEYALAALRLWLFFPLAALVDLAPGNLASWIDFAEQRFALPQDFTRGLRAQLAPAPARPVAWPPAAASPSEQDWSSVRQSMVEGILASATPQRHDRLFPGDIAQFDRGGVCVGHGAAGVLYALNAAGAGRHPRFEDWLLEALRRTPPQRAGFYDGSHGIAYILDQFGYHDEADHLIAHAAPAVDRMRDHGLDRGLSGIGLSLLKMAEARGQDSYRSRALAIAERLSTVLSATSTGGSVPGGLLNGWSGAALFFIAVFEHTGEQTWLARAERALRRDLDTCVPAAGEAMKVLDARSRRLPYLGTGSAGIALAATALARYTPNADAVSALPALLRACHTEFVVHPGLMSGRAGLLLTLARAASRSDPTTARVMSRHLSNLAWHAVPYRDGIAFPGHQLLRLSMDLHTGNAGILLAIAAAADTPEHSRPVALPLLDNNYGALTPTP